MSGNWKVIGDKSQSSLPDVETAAPVKLQNLLKVSVSSVEEKFVSGGVVAVAEEENFL